MEQNRVKKNNQELDSNQKSEGVRRKLSRGLAMGVAAAVFAVPAVSFAESIDQYQKQEGRGVDNSDTFNIPQSVSKYDNSIDMYVEDDEPTQPQEPGVLLDQDNNDADHADLGNNRGDKGTDSSEGDTNDQSERRDREQTDTDNRENESSNEQQPVESEAPAEQDRDNRRDRNRSENRSVEPEEEINVFEEFGVPAGAEQSAEKEEKRSETKPEVEPETKNETKNEEAPVETESQPEQEAEPQAPAEQSKDDEDKNKDDDREDNRRDRSAESNEASIFDAFGIPASVDQSTDEAEEATETEEAEETEQEEAPAEEGSRRDRNRSESRSVEPEEEINVFEEFGVPADEAAEADDSAEEQPSESTDEAPAEDEAEEAPEESDSIFDEYGIAAADIDEAADEAGEQSADEAEDEAQDEEASIFDEYGVPSGEPEEPEQPPVEEDKKEEEVPAPPAETPEPPTPPKEEEEVQEPPLKPISEIADEVIAGKWGKDQDRINRLTEAGYDYNEVQEEVNKRFEGSVLTQTVTEQEAKKLCARAGVEYVGPEQGWKDGVPHPIYICKLPDSVTHDYDSSNPRYANVLIVNQLVAALDEIRAEGIDIEVNSAFRSADRQRELRKENGCHSDTGRAGCRIRIGGVGYSNHNSALAVDVYSSAGYTGKVREIFNKHGFTNTVPDDLIHFEYAGPTVNVSYIIEHGYSLAA